MFEDNLDLNGIKNEPYVIEHILWDMEPKELMAAKFTKTEHGVEKRDDIKGYIFYIETMGEDPILFLMRHTAVEFGETMGQINDIPKELLRESVEETKDRHYFGMYPINNAVKAWLKKELGVK
jgi:hypothetical protein